MIRDFVAIGSSLMPSRNTFDVNSVRQLLCEQQKWLMVVDNVDEEEQLNYLESYMLSPRYRGQVLVTGRLTMLRRISPSQTFEMPLMESGEAVTFLELLLVQQDLKEAVELVEMLGCLPLALEQAALYMIANDISIDMYMERYEAAETRPELLNYNPGSPYSTSVWKAFDISFDHMPTDAQLILKIFAGFGLDSISDEFLQESAQHHPTGNWEGTTDELQDFDRGIPLEEEFRSVLSSSKRREDACDALVRVALLKRQGRRLSMHPVSIVFSV